MHIGPISNTASSLLAGSGLTTNVNGVQPTPAPTGLPTRPESVTASSGIGDLQDASASNKQLEAHLEDAVGAVNAFLKPISSNLEFSIDEESGKTIVKLVDTETNTILRQYPTKETLAIARDIDKFQGLLIKTEA